MYFDATFNEIAEKFGFVFDGDVYLREEIVGGYYEPVYDFVPYTKKEVAKYICDLLYCAAIDIDD